MAAKLQELGEFDMAALDNDALRDLPADLRPKETNQVREYSKCDYFDGLVYCSSC